MSELFAHLYLDEDVSVLLAELLRSQGYEITTALEAGNLHADDDEHLGFAAARGMTVVTHNRRDFEQLASKYVRSGQSHAGIIICVRRSEPQIATRLLKILNEFTADEMRDLLLYV